MDQPSAATKIQEARRVPGAEIPRALPVAQPVATQQPVTVVINNHQSNVNYAGGEASQNGPASAALLIGLGAVVLSFTPAYPYTMVAALLAVALAAVGLLVSIFRRLVGLASSILAVVLAVVALFFALGHAAVDTGIMQKEIETGQRHTSTEAQR